LTSLYFTSGIFNAIFGKIVDLKGQRINIIFIASLLITGCHALFAILPDMEDQVYLPILPLAMMGLSSAMYCAAFYPSLPLLVIPSKTGTVFGVAFCTLNIGLTVLPEVVGYIYDVTQNEKHGFFWVSALLGVISALGIVAALVIMIYYRKDAKFLNNTSKASTLVKKSSIVQ